MTAEKKVQIAEAKGRPMLHWVGKRPLSYVKAFPAQEIERFDPMDNQTSEVFAKHSQRSKGAETSDVSDASDVSKNPGNLLFHGDNKDVLAWLLANGYRGKVDLVYIDPPFDSGADYVRQVQLRVLDTPKFEGEAHSWENRSNILIFGLMTCIPVYVRALIVIKRTVNQQWQYSFTL